MPRMAGCCRLSRTFLPVNALLCSRNLRLNKHIFEYLCNKNVHEESLGKLRDFSQQNSREVFEIFGNSETKKLERYQEIYITQFECNGLHDSFEYYEILQFNFCGFYL